MQDILTVSEAKTKVCPFIQLSESDKIVDTSSPKNINCICGDCMAWKYTKEHIHSDIIYTCTNYNEKEKTNGLTDKHVLIEEEKTLITIDRRYAIVTELLESEKEGYCKRLETPK